MTEWPTRGQQAPDFWDVQLKGYVDEGDSASNVAATQTPPTWAGTTTYAAYQRVALPTGGYGYSTVARTSRATFDATERDTWTFIPGGHFQHLLAGTSSWRCPLGITRITLDIVGAGGPGNGGGSSTSAINQVGGPGGAAGERVIVRGIAVVPGTTYATLIPTGNAGGAGGAAGGNNSGVKANPSASSTMTIAGATYRAAAGQTGSASPANTAGVVVSAGGQGVDWNIAHSAGSGAPCSPTMGAPPIPLGSLVGGAGGGAASTVNVKGGLGGGARTGIGQIIPATPQGTAPTTAGGDGVSATVPGCGGGGGGGGMSGAKGGNGGAGGPSQFVIEF